MKKPMLVAAALSLPIACGVERVETDAIPMVIRENANESTPPEGVRAAAPHLNHAAPAVVVGAVNNIWTGKAGYWETNIPGTYRVELGINPKAGPCDKAESGCELSHALIEIELMRHVDFRASPEVDLPGTYVVHRPGNYPELKDAAYAFVWLENEPGRDGGTIDSGSAGSITIDSVADGEVTGSLQIFPDCSGVVVEGIFKAQHDEAFEKAARPKWMERVLNAYH